MRHVPYLTSEGAVDFASLVSELTTDGTQTIAPGTHEIWFTGSAPCAQDGTALDMVSQPTTQDFGSGLIANMAFSMKVRDPEPRNYVDYYEKFTTYERLIGVHARAVDLSATAKTFPPQEMSADESVFVYLDAATSRAGIGAAAEKLALGKVAIVGLGGTGSYILDLVAKTPVQEIHLFDDDEFSAHNAFRSPGAASVAGLREHPRKVNYLESKYQEIRRGILPHVEKIDGSNLSVLHDMDFVFLTMDAGQAKARIFEYLTAEGIPFVDCGIGLVPREGNSLAGIVRVTTVLPDHKDHVASRVSFAETADDEYDRNIQTGDMNMLNAVLAVIKWKKYFGFYIDSQQELNSQYVISSNRLNSGDQVA
jgi:hypothetical protein